MHYECAAKILFLIQRQEVFLIKDGAGYLTERTGLGNLKYTHKKKTPNNPKRGGEEVLKLGM